MREQMDNFFFFTDEGLFIMLMKPDIIFPTGNIW